MSKKQISALKARAREYRKNKALVEKKLRKAGVKKPDPALVFAAASYYRTLNRLAKG
jgi:hypothetical protein